MDSMLQRCHMLEDVSAKLFAKSKIVKNVEQFEFYTLSAVVIKQKLWAREKFEV